MTGQWSAHRVRLARAFLRGPPHDFAGSRIVPAKDLTLRGALLIILFWLVGHSQTASAGQIYWAEPQLGKIMRANDNGTQVQVVLDETGYVGSFAIDIVGRKLYWTGSPAGYGIYRSNVDGTEIEKLVEPPSSITAVTVDADIGRMFWFADASEEIFTANLDGSDVRRQFGSQTDLSRSFAVDPVGGCLYFTQGDGVVRESIDGNASCAPRLAVGRFPDAFTWRIALDVPNGELYWSERDHSFPANGFGSIRRIGFDGTGMGTIIASPLDAETGFRVFGVAIDTVGQRIYWTERALFGGPDDFTIPRIRRANLDGTGIEDLEIPGLSHPDTIVFDPIPEPASILLLLIGCGLSVLRGGWYGVAETRGGNSRA